MSCTFLRAAQLDAVESILASCGVPPSRRNRVEMPSACVLSRERRRLDSQAPATKLPFSPAKAATRARITARITTETAVHYDDGCHARRRRRPGKELQQGCLAAESTAGDEVRRHAYREHTWAASRAGVALVERAEHTSRIRLYRRSSCLRLASATLSGKHWSFAELAVRWFMTEQWREAKAIQGSEKSAR